MMMWFGVLRTTLESSYLTECYSNHPYDVLEQKDQSSRVVTSRSTETHCKNRPEVSPFKGGGGNIELLIQQILALGTFQDVPALLTASTHIVMPLSSHGTAPRR